MAALWLAIVGLTWWAVQERIDASVVIGFVLGKLI